jgi:hypothetical protein
MKRKGLFSHLRFRWLEYVRSHSLSFFFWPKFDDPRFIWTSGCLSSLSKQRIAGLYVS